MTNNIDKYRRIFFSFLYRDDVYPAIIKSKGFTIKGFIKVFIDSIIDDITALFKRNSKSINNKIWLYTESLNQYRAFEILKEYPDVVFVTYSKGLIEKTNDNSIVKLHLESKLKHRFQSFPYFYKYKLIFKSKFITHLNTIIKYDCVYESLLDLLKNHSPKAIIFSNDHNAFCRALLLAGKESGIKTIYLQHASVTDQFPPLEFDLNLLEGKDSLIKYQKAGKIEGKVELIGMSKADRYYKNINRRQTIKSIGIALNSGDNFTNYFNLFKNLNLQYSNLEYYVRFHPSIKVENIIIPTFFKISRTEQENSFDFISKIDLLFSGNSSIHLEAAIMNVPSIQIDFKEILEKDYYGFLKQELVEKLSPAEVSSWLKNNMKHKKNVRDKAKFYVDTINTVWDGRSNMKVMNSIDYFLKN